MKQRILILAEYDPAGAYPYGSAVINNTGNNVFIRSICSYFRVGDARLVTFAEAEARLREDPDWCRRQFDAVVTYEACILSKAYAPDMLRMTDLYRRLGVSVFVIGIGVAAPRGIDSHYVDDFSNVAKRYLDVIYSSGGAVTVRGAISRDICARLGFGDVFVSGCGSLYYGGADFSIGNNKVVRADFVPAFNGYLVDDINARWFSEFPRAVFFDQDIYYHALLYPDFVSDDELRRIFSKSLPRLYKTVFGMSGRIQTRQDPASWQWALHTAGISFSYGSRMHGNAIALLSGIPAFLKVIDARTEELADFYRLPSSLTVAFDERKDSLYDLYRSLDWTEFNANYQRIYHSFVAWTERCGLPAAFASGLSRQEPRELYASDNGLAVRQRRLLWRIRKQAFQHFFPAFVRSKKS